MHRFVFVKSGVRHLQHLVIVEEADHGESAVSHDVCRSRAPQGRGHGHEVTPRKRLRKAVRLEVLPHAHGLHQRIARREGGVRCNDSRSLQEWEKRYSLVQSDRMRL